MTHGAAAVAGVTYLTEAEVDALLEACNQHTWTGRRDHAMFALTIRPAYGSPNSRAWPVKTSPSLPAPTCTPSAREGRSDAHRSCRPPSIQWSRRFTGLKLFLTLTLAVLGRDGYATQIERDTNLGEQLRAGLISRGWHLANNTLLPLVCFTDPHTDNLDVDASAAHHDALAAAVLAGGQAWISPTRLNGRPALRACITSYRTTETDVRALLNALAQARATAVRQSR